MNIKQRIAELKKELARLEYEDRKEVWKPEVGERYYYIDIDGGVSFWTVDESTEIDKNVIEYGNYYKTEEEAEHQAKVQKYTNQFRKYVEAHSEKIDWKDKKKYKFYIFFDYDCNGIGFDYNTIYKSAKIYASSKEVLKDAIEYVGEANVIQYVLGVED